MATNITYHFIKAILLNGVNICTLIISLTLTLFDFLIHFGN